MVRFRNPIDGAVVVEDVIHGNVVFDNTELDDLIIARSDGTPTYNFCVVVDDMDMKVTHVIRGDDHLNNTPRQINMLRALGAATPVYAHVPMILGADGAKLSKRHGAVSVLQYREEGYLPEALLNYLVRLGWSHGDQEVFSMRGDAAAVRHQRRQQVGVGVQSRQAAVAQSAAHHARDAGASRASTCKPQLAALGVAVTDDAQAHRRREGAAGARQDAAGDGAEQRVLLPRFHQLRREGREEESDCGERRAAARSAREARRRSMSGLPPAIHEAVNQTATELSVGLGKVAQPIRVAVVRHVVSPPIDVTLEVLGRKRPAALARLHTQCALDS